MNKETLNSVISELTHFTGSENYYKHWIGITYTEGVKFLAEKFNCFWLIDAIASHQINKNVRKEQFQVWTIRKEKSKWILEVDDGNRNILAEQVIEYSDFPLEEFKLYLCDLVLMLISEY